MKIRNTIAVMICIMLFGKLLYSCSSSVWQRKRRRRFLGLGNDSGVHGKIVLSASLAKAFSFGSSRRRRNRSRRC